LFLSLIQAKDTTAEYIKQAGGFIQVIPSADTSSPMAKKNIRGRLVRGTESVGRVCRGCDPMLILTLP